VHGLAGSSLNWTDLMHLLAPALPGVAVDLPGFGLSEPPPEHDYSLGSHTAAVASVIEAEGGRPVHVFGNSLGGAVAVRLAVERPDLVRSLTLVSPALPVFRLKWTNVHMPLMLLPGLPGLLFRLPPASTPDARAELFISLCWADERRLHPHRRAEMLAEVRHREGFEHTDRAYVESLRGLASGFLARGSGNLWGYAERVERPTLLVFGRRDRLIDVSIAERAGRTIRGSELVVMDDVGHVAQMEAPDRVAALVLNRLSPTAPASPPPA
jgi:pimeloyl-ACP methyl ester carboxylesterase